MYCLAVVSESIFIFAVSHFDDISRDTTETFLYFRKQNRIMEEAVEKMDSYLAGDTNARIDCDDEGEMYRLFHTVNSLVAVLNAHAEKESRSKGFLKNTISDISHQLKTPLAALNVYNGLGSRRM